MRVTLATAVAALALSAATGAQHAPAHPCRASLPHGPSVPASIILWSSCGVFRLESDGHVTRLDRHWLAHHGSGTGRRYGADLRVRRTRDGAMILQRGGRTIWRTRRLHPHGGDVAFGPGVFAFTSYFRGIYVTDLHGPERLVAPGRGLYVLDFTRRGLLLVVGRHMLTVVARSGRLLRRYAYAPERGLGFDEEADTLYFVTPRAMLAEAAHGTRLRLLRRVAAQDGYMSVVDPRLLVWYGRRSITVTDRVGTSIASTHWLSALGNADLGLTASSDGRFFAYRLSTAEREGPVDSRLFVLRPAETHGRLVLRHRLGGVGCGVPGHMSWHGPDLLYDFGNDDRLAVLDARSGGWTKLTALARSIPRRFPADTVDAAWASGFARPTRGT
jgi:hypothetical protein